MTPVHQNHEELLQELGDLRLRLQEAEETLDAIRTGGIDALVVAAAPGEEQLFTLEGADRIYRVFLESISQGALTLSAEGLILYANEAAIRLLSSAPAGPVGAHLRTFVRVDERHRFDALLERARSGAVHGEIGMRSRQGRLPLYLSLQPLEDRGDRMVVTVMTDLSDQKTTKMALESERLARSIFEQAGEPILVCDKDGVIIRASRSAAELVGQQPLFQTFDAVLPLHGVDGRTFSLRSHVGPRRIRTREVRFDRPDGASFTLLLTANPLNTTTQGLVGRVITLTDVTSLKEAERATEQLLLDVERANTELAAIESLSHAGLKLASVGQLAHSIVSQVAKAMNADEVTLLLAADDRVELAASVPPVESGRRPVEMSGGFVGAIARMRRSLFVEDARSSHLVTRRERARGSRSLLGAPLLEGSDLLGVLCVGWKQAHAADAGQQRFLEIIADRAAAALAARLLADERDEQRLAAEALAVDLAEANAKLLGRQEILDVLQELTTLATSSLSLAEIGRKVLETAQRRLGLAAATLYTMDDAGATLSALALIGFPGDAAASIDSLPVDETSASGRIVLRGLLMLTHESDFGTSSSSRWLYNATGIDGARWIVLRLESGGRTLGVLGLTFLGERPFTEDEIAVYRSIAELLSSAFRNARLYEEQLGIATTLQENFIRPLPEVPGIEVGLVSATAREPELVGGDFSDVLELPDGQIMVMIGDVAGKGIKAAGLTETVRSMVRALATVDSSPAFVLGKINELLLMDDPDDAHVTAFLAVLDPRTGHLSYATAGHPPAVHCGSYSCRPLDAVFGVPLRSFPRQYVSEHVQLSLDDYLILYTDGVIEARSDGQFFGEERLVALIEDLKGRSPQEMAEAVRDAAIEFSGGLKDDLHVVCVRLA